MNHRLSVAAVALLVAAPLAAQAPQGWQMRVDQSTNAADPDDVPNVTFTAVGSGFQVNTGPAAVVWNPENTAEGEYTIKGTFTMLEPSGHANYYGVVFGGAALEGSRQNYLYFLIAQNGTFLVKRRANDEAVHDLQPRTPHEAVVKPDPSGQSVNELEVRVGADEIDFVVNGTVVHTQPRTGMASQTDGIWGARINHRMPGVVVEGLSVSR